MGLVHDVGCEHDGKVLETGRRPVLAPVISPTGVAPRIRPDVRALIAEIDSSLARVDVHRSLRETLFIQLLFASRTLADASVRNDCGGSFCRECCGLGETPTRVMHARDCAVYRVQRIVEELYSTVEFYPEGKETATGSEETGRAGDGIRPRAAASPIFVDGMRVFVCFDSALAEAGSNDWIFAFQPPAGGLVYGLTSEPALMNDRRNVVIMHKPQGGAR